MLFFRIVSLMSQNSDSSNQNTVSSPVVDESDESKELALQVRFVNERQISEGQKVLTVKLPSMISRLSEYIQVAFLGLYIIL